MRIFKMRKLKSFVLDTSIFVNPHARSPFGEDPTEACRAFCELAIRCSGIVFYVSPTTFAEIRNFVKDDYVRSLFSRIVVIKAPSPTLPIPARVFQEYVREVRKRFDKGLRLIEEALLYKGDVSEGKKKFREKYRRLVRHGILDSEADFETIALALETKSILVTVDEGMMDFAKELGIPYVDAKEFRKILEKEASR